MSSSPLAELAKMIRQLRPAVEAKHGKREGGLEGEGEERERVVVEGEEKQQYKHMHIYNKNKYPQNFHKQQAHLLQPGACTKWMKN